MEVILRFFSAALLSLSSLAASAQPQETAAPAFVEKMATPATLNQVRQGGFVLYMRHGNTDNSKPDRVPSVDLKDCSTQRPLTDEGRQLAAQVGKSIRAARIPVAEIHVSPLCRAKESAQAAFGNKFQVNEFLMYTSNLTTEEKKPILETTRGLLSAPVAKSSNRVIVAHAPNMADLIGYFVKPEGTVVVIRPKGDAGFEYIASIPPNLWRELLP